MASVELVETPIPGLLVLRLPVHGDSRGWFKENWQREKMTALGLPDFGPVQNNISFNAGRGATRGIHAEPAGVGARVADTGRHVGARAGRDRVGMRCHQGAQFQATCHANPQAVLAGQGIDRLEGTGYRK